MNMIRSGLFAMVFLIFLGLGSAEAKDPAGVFTHIAGRIDMTSPGQKARAAHVGDEVHIGDIIRAKSRSRAEITLADESILRLAQNTRVEISNYMIQEDQHVGRLRLFRGKIQSIVKKTLKKIFGFSLKRRFEVHTTTAVCGVRGTNFITYYQRGLSGAIFIEGQGYGYSINHPEVIRDIGAGQVMVVSDAELPPLVRSASAVEMLQHLDDTTPAGEDGKESTEGGDPVGESGENRDGTSSSESENAASEEHSSLQPDGASSSEGEDPLAGEDVATEEAQTELAMLDGSPPTVDESNLYDEQNEFIAASAPFDPVLTSEVDLVYTVDPGSFDSTTTEPVEESSTLEESGSSPPPPEPEPFHGFFDGVFDGWLGNPSGFMNGDLMCSESVWSGLGTFDVSGRYDHPSDAVLWTGEWGGEFYPDSPDALRIGGFMGGTIWSHELEGRGVGLFVRKDGTAGLVKSGLIQGLFHPNPGDWEAGGPVETIPMGHTSVTLSEFYFGSPAVEVVDTGGDVWGDLNGRFEQSAVCFSDTPEWGMWWSISGGDTSLLPDEWNAWATQDIHDEDFIFGAEIDGRTLTDGRLVGSVLGHYADFLDPETSVIVGELQGSFDPSALTWEAVQTGFYLDTHNFLAMANTSAGREKLQKLDIPCIQVGRADLTGYNGNIYVAMQDVLFFAYSNGATPRVWATKNIQGTFNNPPSYPETVFMSGNGLDASFAVKKWSAGRWLAAINNGQGTYSGSGSMNGRYINFYGAAAGRYTSGTFTGAGSGVAK